MDIPDPQLRLLLCSDGRLAPVGIYSTNSTITLTIGLVVEGKEPALGVGGMGSIGALKVHLLRSELGLLSHLLRGPGLLPRLGLLVVDSKDLALGVGRMSSIGALEIHLLSSKLGLSSKLLRGPGLLPWLGLLSVAGSRCSGGHFAVNFGRQSCLEAIVLILAQDIQGSCY